ncbi:MAG: GDP-mannose 4,6-dehydratase [Gemmatimonadaceae bacterium]|nr:GDP-mannose 4,6-dehydratase [Gemmatimonadaceae bacterium]
MTTRALVTGANGFVAQWAMKAMLSRGWSVTAAGFDAAPSSSILTGAEHDAIDWRRVDVTSQPEIAATLDAATPDAILHLAGVSFVPTAMADPGHAYDVNAVGVVRLLTEVRRHRVAGVADPTILVIGSAEQYGRHDLHEMPLGESAEQRPLTLYAASKVAQEVAALQACRSDGMRVICTRSFNHSGIGHGQQFLLPALVGRALALPATGGSLAIGNADTTRDFTHVADVAEAYLALLERGETGQAYNVCSGRGVTVRQLAEAVLERVGRSAKLATDPSLKRAVDVTVQIGSNAKLRAATGWEPRRAYEDIIDDLIHAATR